MYEALCSCGFQLHYKESLTYLGIIEINDITQFRVFTGKVITEIDLVNTEQIEPHCLIDVVTHISNDFIFHCVRCRLIRGIGEVNDLTRPHVDF